MAHLPKRPEEILQEAALRLKGQSPGMSLRAVAARLKITPSYWSKILRGKKPLSQALLPRVVKVLGLDAQNTAQLQRAILEGIEREQLAPATGIRTIELDKASPIQAYKSLGREEYWILSDWFYIPILNLLTLTDFHPAPEEIAERLGLSPPQVAQALARLVRAGLLRKEETGLYRRTEEKVRFPTARSLPEIRRFHQLMLKRAGEELGGRNTEETFRRRQISSVCFAGPAEKLEEARLIMEEAMYRVANLMADEPESNEVFHLGIQLFPLTKPKR